MVWKKLSCHKPRKTLQFLEPVFKLSQRNSVEHSQVNHFPAIFTFGLFSLAAGATTKGATGKQAGEQPT
jgi:hypothetical protein